MEVFLVVFCICEVDIESRRNSAEKKITSVGQSIISRTIRYNNNNSNNEETPSSSTAYTIAYSISLSSILTSYTHTHSKWFNSLKRPRYVHPIPCSPHIPCLFPSLPSSYLLTHTSRNACPRSLTSQELPSISESSLDVYILIGDLPANPLSPPAAISPSSSISV